MVVTIISLSKMASPVTRLLGALLAGTVMGGRVDDSLASSIGSLSPMLQLRLKIQWIHEHAWSSVNLQLSGF